ncbi:4-alpha-glucanotransferase [Neosynechococcus sphagnicola sy1]|uniref:4-alpha-glucanotransferase n=1 Tax=Neosynechococcus sphagnicola sy1 TaxID=1497020 RepID=A0A098TKQ2_9CYAN|nr:4-alpha-glucanotransferase [Neosynechococcus sphagnicola]KGF72427.1 4-alpha-glucanotransferase [Neosynechococcus sphagnicola sy1]
MPFARASGVLLHPTSLPSRFGIGDLGAAAYAFIDFLHQSQQQLWQVLPLGPTGYGNSPYMCYSAMAGNPLLISPELLAASGLLTAADWQDLPSFSSTSVDFASVGPSKFALLRKACDAFRHQASIDDQHAFRQFCQTKRDWLEDYALFMALKTAHNGASWQTWELEIVQRQPTALEQWRRQLGPEIFLHQYLQFEFFRQWSALKAYANQQGIQIIGDIPIYVAHDSADVWAHPQNFCLDEQGEPAWMAGVPPDYFSDTGQLWGNPVYNWEYLQQSHFQWWIQRFRSMLEYVDIIRIDHFRGFEAFWAIPQGEETAIQGEWVEAPGTELFEVLKQELGTLPILAEDLGIITPEVEALRDRFEFPGMKILQFAFGSGPGNPYLPFNYQRNCVVYTGTHDNDTTVGWFSQLSPYEQTSLQRYLGSISSDGVQWDLIRLALSSIANQAIIPLQDLLGLGTEARMNFPGKAEGNWGWRYQPDALTQALREQLQDLTERFGRAPQPNSQSE